jgi:Bacteriophage tail sheath protein
MRIEPAPGLYFEIASTPEDPAPLRSDIAGFIGPTRRGPVGEVVRVEEWPEYERLFGGLETASTTSYAVSSYFENGGDVAYVLRLAGTGAATARATWPPAPGDPLLPGHRVVWPAGTVQSEAFLSNGQSVRRIAIAASSPGGWAEGTELLIEYRRQGSLGQAEVDIITRVPHEPTETLRALPVRFAGVPPVSGKPPDENPVQLVNVVNRQSRYIRLAIDPADVIAPTGVPGPNRLQWRVTLTGGLNAPPGVPDYLAAIDAISREPAVAILALPDLYTDLPFDFDPSAIAQPSLTVLRAAVTAAERLHDRLVLVDLPADNAVATMPLTTDRIVAAVSSLRDMFEEHERRAVAVYHPPVWVPDRLGGVTALRLVPASGPVAGVISRLDVERGAHHTPANAVLYDAVDILQSFDPVDQGRLNHAGVNVVRCFPGRGLAVWGGRTLDTHPAGQFVAHRRLSHRIVRAIQRVANPLVFDINGPELWLTIVRGITSVLLEAYRGGALKGARPDEAFRVKCDDETNPPDERDRGLVTCIIQFAPSVPMEFITLRVAFGREGNLEVFER